MFSPDSGLLSSRHKKIHKIYTILGIINDFAAGLAFVVGSYFDFYPKFSTDGSWLFLIGSILFCMRPSIVILREIHLACIGRQKSAMPDPSPPRTSSHG